MRRQGLFWVEAGGGGLKKLSVFLSVLVDHIEEKMVDEICHVLENQIEEPDSNGENVKETLVT